MIPFIPGMTLRKGYKFSANIQENDSDEDEVSEIIDLAYKLEGIAKKCRQACWRNSNRSWIDFRFLSNIL